MSRLSRIFTPLLSCLVLASSIAADTVILRDGQQIEGRIVSQSREAVRIDTAGGARSIPKDRIRRIVYGRVDDKAAAEREKEKKEREERLQKLRDQKKKEQEEREKKETEADTQKAEAEAAEEARRQEEAERLRQLQLAQAPGEITLPGALLRSAILPGWGQIYQDRVGAGAAYTASFILLAGGTGAAIAHHEFTRKQYRETAEDAFIYTPFFFDLIGPVSPVNSSTFTRDQFTQLGLYHQSNVYFARQEMIAAGKIADGARTALLAFYIWNLTDVFLFHPGSTGGEIGFFVLPEEAGFRYQLRF